MLYNLYEIASSYNLSERTLRRKINAFNKLSKFNPIKTFRKGNKNALVPSDIKRLLEFMGYDFELVKQRLNIKLDVLNECPTSPDFNENVGQNLDESQTKEEKSDKKKDKIEISRTEINQKSDSNRTISDNENQSGQKTDTTRTNENKVSEKKEVNSNKSDKFLSDIDDILELLKSQIKMKDDQLEAKDQIIKQQNAIIMATQKNMNDMLQHHNELQFSHAKKEDLIKQLEYDRSKTESTIKSISKLERLIDDALITKRLKDGIEFSNNLMKNKKSLKV